MKTFVEFKLLDPDLETVHGILPFQSGDLYVQLNEPGSGAVKTALNIASADLVESGGFVDVNYRDSSRGGFFVENIGENEVNAQEETGKALEVSGRGALALLEDAIVWSDGTGANKRIFSGTQAGMLIDLIDEAKVRGALSNLTYDFTDTLDSDDVPWTDDFPLELTVGTSLLDIVRQIGKTGIDFNILPDGEGNFVLSAYKDGIGSDKSSTVYFRVGVNCEEVSSQEAGGGIRNALLLKYKGGYTTVSDAGSIAARRRRETTINYDFAQSSASASTLGSAELGNKKDPKRQIAVRIYDGSGPKVFVDYGLGDTITLDRFGNEASYRIRGIHLSWNENGYSEVIVDLNSMILENEIRITQDVDWLMNEWKTAHDAGLLEVRFWAAIGDKNLNYNAKDLLIAGNTLYVANGSDSSLLLYDLIQKSWSKVEIPLPPFCLANVGTNIYIGAADRVYVYDGTNVTEIGEAEYDTNPLFIDVRTMVAIGTDIYCGGVFDEIEGVPITGIAKYDTLTDTWTDIGGGGFCTHALITDGSNLFAAFSTDVKKWDGSSWTQLGASFSATVLSLAVYGTNLLAGSNQTGGIFLWNGSGWSTFGGGVGGGVYDIGVFLEDVYVGGDFTDAGNHIAKYSGGSWWELEEGTNDIVNDIVMSGDDLYVVGLFTTAGDKVVQGIAAYFNNFESLADYLESSTAGFDLAAAIHNATAKTSMTGADEIPLWDSLTSKLRKITWTNIIASIKSWADGIYVALTGNQNIAGVKTFLSFPVTPSSAPTSDYEVANKKYVDDNAGGGGGTPGGSDTQVQYNDDGVFAGDVDLIWNKVLKQLWIGGNPISNFTGKGIGIIAEGGGADVARDRLFHFGTQTSGPGITTGAAGGTRASPTATTNGMVLGQWSIVAWYDDHEDDKKTIGYIRAVATNDHATGDQPFKWEIYTCPSGSDTPTLAMTITSDGHIDIAAGKEYRVNGSQHQHAASDITSGTIATARLGSGTADATKRLAGDNTWVDAPKAETQTVDIFRVNSPGFASVFAAKINGDPTNVANSVVTFDTVTAGGVAVITPASSSQLAKIILHNTTRGTSAQILTASGATITMTSNVYALGWRDNDNITIASQTVSVSGVDFIDIEFTGAVANRPTMFLLLTFNGSVAGSNLVIHPFTAWTPSKAFYLLCQVATIANVSASPPYEIITNKLAIGWTGTPSFVIVREGGYL